MALTPTCRLRQVWRTIHSGQVLVLQQWWAGPEGDNYNLDTEEVGSWIDVPVEHDW